LNPARTLRALKLKADRDPLTAIGDRYELFDLDRDAIRLQFDHETIAVDRFEKAWTEGGMTAIAQPITTSVSSSMLSVDTPERRAGIAPAGFLHRITNCGKAGSRSTQLDPSGALLRAAESAYHTYQIESSCFS